MSHGFLSSLTGLVLFLVHLPTDKSVGYSLFALTGEWHLHNAQNFWRETFAATRVGCGVEDNAARELFHLLEVLAKFPEVADRLFHLGKLFSGQGDGNGFLSHFARPLVTGSAAFAGGPILNRSLADVTELSQAAA
jgi:hypothetical protein